MIMTVKDNIMTAAATSVTCTKAHSVQTLDNDLLDTHDKMHILPEKYGYDNHQQFIAFRPAVINK